MEKNKDTDTEQTEKPINRSPIPNAKPFVKGDPRINRKGRPKNFDKARELAKQVAILKKTGTNTKTGEKFTTTPVSLIFIDWAESKDIRKQRALLEYAYGKVPDAIEIKADIKTYEKVKLEVTDYAEIARVLIDAGVLRSTIASDVDAAPDEIHTTHAVAETSGVLATDE